MANFNKVVLVGNVTRDPQTKVLPSQMMVAEFGIAVNRSWTDQSGDKREEVTFVDVSAFGKQAELIGEYVKKGDPLLVEGRLKYDTWEDKDQNKRSKLSVVVENFQFLKSKGDGEAAPKKGRPKADEIPI